MAKRWTHTSAFAHFGTKPHNVQWSWSARSGDGKTVVVTLWQDLFTRERHRLIYSRPGSELSAPDRRPGFRELMENLTWARDNCEGQFKIIIAIAKDVSAEPRAIAECFPSPMTMKLTHLDVSTGAFTAEANSALRVGPRLPLDVST
jgi:hypothetical protein